MKNVYKFTTDGDTIVVELNLTIQKDGIIQSINKLTFHKDDLDIVEKELDLKFDMEEEVMYIVNVDEFIEKFLNINIDTEVQSS